jgi:TolB-like protein/DNA-binding winged helix-turn-helix (wHTH) protein/Tfp pilus assembly protein PilF
MGEPRRADSRVRFGVFTVDLEAGELLRDGTRLRLQERPLQLLLALLAKPGEIVTRDELRERLWPDGTFVDFDHGISSAVNKLRSALNDSAATPRYIETIGSRGYRFLYPVTPIPSSDAAPVPDKFTSGLRPLRLALLMGGVGATAVVALIAFGDFPRTADPASMAIRSIAVMPLRNLSSDPAQEYFSEGLTDELITRLASLEGLRVISRLSAMRYRDSSRPLPEIARELNVDAVLQGSVLESGGRVRITVQLVEGATDRHVWAESYERDHRDILQLQAEVARDIAERIHVRVNPAAARRPAQERRLNPEAHQAYLLARHRWHTRHGDQLIQAIADYQRAIAIDPEFALAYAGLADVHLVLPLLTGAVTQEDSYPKAKEAADRAIQLDPYLAEAHNSRAYVRLYLDWDFAGAEQGFRRAIELNPGYATAHQWYAELLSFLGRHDEAIREIVTALELDPLSAVMHHQAGQTYQQARRYDQAVAEYRIAETLDRGFIAPRMFLSLAYRRMGLLVEASEAMNTAFPGEKKWMEELASAARTGDLQSYLRSERNIATLLARPAYYFGLYDAALGRSAEAFQWLGKAFERRDECLLYLKVDPEWDPLRAEPEFQAFLQKVGLP